MGAAAYNINPKKLKKLYVTDEHSVREVAEIMGISIATVSRALKKFKIKTRGNAPRPGFGSGTKLDPEQVREIRRRLRTETQAALAEEFGVTRQAISLLANGITHAKKRKAL
jgi:transposase